MKRLLLLMGLGLLGACQERLALPSTCPELCPGSGVEIRDTVIEAIAGKDSSYSGYLSFQEPPATLVSSGLAAGEARGWAYFAGLPDSVFVNLVGYAYSVDSMAFSISLLARDTSVKNVQLIIHRIPIVDSTVSLAELDQAMTAETVVDSAMIPDTLVRGTLRVPIRPEGWPKLVPDSINPGQIAVGFRISSVVPTGIRLGSTVVGSGPTWSAYLLVASTDTAQQHRTYLTVADSTNYLIEEPPASDPGNLLLGSRSGTRSILRFLLPKALRDSSTVIRATLELTLARPVLGLPNDPATVQGFGVLVDVGAKSPAFGGAVGVIPLPTGATGLQKIEVLGPVASWFGPSGLTPTLILGLVPEGGTFTRAEFFSTRSPAGAPPRLRITYAVPSRSGFP